MPPPPSRPVAAMAPAQAKPRKEGVLFVRSFFRTFVYLQPHEISPDLNRRIEERLKRKHEGVCSRIGFVKEGSLSVQRCGDGVMQRQYFNGNWRFDIVCHAMVARPAEGDKLWGTLMETTNAGWIVYVHDEDSPKRNIVMSASIPNGSLYNHQEGALPKVTRGTRVRFQIMKVSLVGRDYVRVIGVKLEIGGPADPDLSAAIPTRASAVPDEEELDLNEERAELAEPPAADDAGDESGDDEAASEPPSAVEDVDADEEDDLDGGSDMFIDDAEGGADGGASDASDPSEY